MDVNKKLKFLFLLGRGCQVVGSGLGGSGWMRTKN